MRSALLLATAIMGMGSAAHAQQILAAGSIFGGPAQVRAVCYFYNAGLAAVTLTDSEISDENGTVLPLAVDQCHATGAAGTALGAGKACGIAADIANNSPYNCQVSVSPNKTNVRGILEVRDSNQVPLKNVELR
jgi:hypothetical protein